MEDGKSRGWSLEGVVSQELSEEVPSEQRSAVRQRVAMKTGKKRVQEEGLVGAKVLSWNRDEEKERGPSKGRLLMEAGNMEDWGIEFPIFFRKIFMTSSLVVDLKLSLVDWTQVVSVPVLDSSSKLIPFTYLGAQ